MFFPSHILSDIPDDIVEQIIDWTHAFHRADATERLHQFRSAYNSVMAHICEDIRMNTPIYRFVVRTQSGIPIYINLCLPQCDPYNVRPHQVPESRIEEYSRRSFGIGPYRV
jgi:hypothetical protein